MTTATGQLVAEGFGPEQSELLSGPLRTLTARDGSEVGVVSVTCLREGVYRLGLDGATSATVVVKRLRAKRAQLERRVTGRWLPAVGMDTFGPPRRAAVGEADGRHVWHVYDDLGAWGLDGREIDSATIDVAMDRLADLHASFAGHPMLSEPRFAAGDLGAYFYTCSVRGALRCVDALQPPAVDLSPQEAAVRDTVRAHLARLQQEEPRRVRLIEDHGGPETLVHGDLTRANVFVLPGASGPLVRLIDWDHVGVGPAGFDISTHVAYYGPAQRRLALERYTTAMAERGHPFRDDLDWDLLVATFEAGRLANQVIWVALGILEGNGWTFRELAAWADALAAVVDPRPAAVSERA